METNGQATLWMTISPIAPTAVPQKLPDAPGEEHSSSSCQHRDFQKLTFASFASHFLVTAPCGIFLSSPVCHKFSPASSVAKHFKVCFSNCSSAAQRTAQAEPSGGGHRATQPFWKPCSMLPYIIHQLIAHLKRALSSFNCFSYDIKWNISLARLRKLGVNLAIIPPWLLFVTIAQGGEGVIIRKKSQITYVFIVP